MGNNLSLRTNNDQTEAGLRKTERETERDELLVEVNISQRGYNDRYELGVGLWDEENGKERKRSKLRER